MDGRGGVEGQGQEFELGPVRWKGGERGQSGVTERAAEGNRGAFPILPSWMRRIREGLFGWLDGRV